VTKLKINYIIEGFNEMISLYITNYNILNMRISNVNDWLVSIHKADFALLIKDKPSEARTSCSMCLFILRHMSRRQSQLEAAMI
jgi:hypothetical protein